MSELHVYSLYSGSTGNAFLISTPSAKLLIDAGKSARRLSAALGEVGVSPEELTAVFVTHEHSDHISALPVFLKKHPIPVHITQGSAPRLACDPAAEDCLVVHPPIFTVELDGLRVTSFPTPHDSHSSVGYRVEQLDQEGSTRFTLGYATDIGHISRAVEEALTGCDAVILESNHDLGMLMDGPYPYELKMRVASRRGHLSNEDSAALAARLSATGTRSLMLAHLSAENNTPDTAYDACFSAIGDAGVTLCIATPENVVELPLDL